MNGGKSKIGNVQDPGSARYVGAAAEAPRRRGWGRGGFTLIELMITVVILSIVTAGVYQLYLTQYRQSISQELRSEMLQRVRVAMNDMTRDMQMAGFKPRVDAVNVASATQLTAEQLNNLLPAQPVGYTKDRRITYRFDAANKQIMKRVQVWNTTDPNPDKYTNTAEIVYLDSITNLGFAYFDKTGAAMAAPVAAGSLGDIRRIDVTLTAETSKIDPITKNKRTITLTSQIYPRNLGIEESTLDQTCPATPTGLSPTDPQACGQIDLAWNANSEADLAGYRIHYGVAPGLYSGTLTVGEVTSATLDGLANSVTHYVAIGSFDDSSNSCALSAEVSGTGPGAPDSQPNPALPQQTLNLDASSSPAGVNLTWAKNQDSYAGSRPDTDANVFGYSVYRSSDNGSTYTKIADKVSGSSYLDVPGPSLSCKKLWYKVEPVNCLDLAGPFSSEAYGDGAGLPTGVNDVDAPQNGVTSTAVLDSVLPAPPTGLLSKSGYQRNFLVWANPNDTDFSHTVVRYSTSGFPSTPIDGTAVESAPGGNGRFDGSPSQTMTFTHDGGGGTPSLTVNTTYYYTIFAYDLCGNVSSAQASAQTAAAQCGDEPSGPSSGPPPAPTLPNPYYTNSCAANQATIQWDLVDDTFPAGIFDLAGYNVYRATNNIAGPYTKQNSSILFGGYPGLRTYTDTTVVPGNTYYYKITATDCDWEVNGGVNGGGESVASSIIKVTPGALIRSTANPQVLSRGDSHEKVIFWIKNAKDDPPQTSLGQIRLETLILEYGKSLARVAKVTLLHDINDSSDDEVIYNNTSAPVSAGSGSSIALTPAILDGQVETPVEVEFRTTSGSVSGTVDMRAESITATWGYENVATTLDDCGSVMTVRVPLSPDIKSVVQDKPFAPTPSSLTPGVITVAKDDHVNVIITAADPDAVGITGVKLYWKESNKNDTTPPTSGWNEITMIPLGGGVYAADDNPFVGGDSRIPDENDKRIWFYMIATDALGNFDRSPEPDQGAFVYYQSN